MWLLILKVAKNQHRVETWFLALFIVYFSSEAESWRILAAVQNLD
jgi:hypothetical protein